MNRTPWRAPYVCNACGKRIVKRMPGGECEKCFKEKFICKLCNKTCCAKPAPVSYEIRQHQKGVSVADLDAECQWWFECYTCEYVCKCEV